MRFRAVVVGFVLFFASFGAQVSQAQGLTPKETQEMKRMLFERYDKQTLNFVGKKMFRVSMLKEGDGNVNSYGVHYYHFYETLTPQYWPKERPADEFDR